jgi:indole-3-glycerol phosphate synthase
MNILEKILAHKKREVVESKNRISVKQLEASQLFNRPGHSLSQFLQEPYRTGIIAEFKRKSPSRGLINGSAKVEDVSAAYATYASGISILTDTEFFGGNLTDLASARFNKIPLLRKDFIIDEYQLIEARAYGADVILLIAACLTSTEVKRLAKTGRVNGLEVLLEIHDESELEHISDDVNLVGINNRNLKTFTVDIRTSLELIRKIPPDFPVVTESGISDVASIITLKEAGCKGFLIGENFMKHEDPGAAFADFVQQLKAASHSGGGLHHEN